MNVLLLLPFVLISTARADAPAKGIDCTAIYRTLDDKQNILELKANIPVKTKIGGQTKHEVEFQSRYFSVTEDTNGDLFGLITKAPDFTEGTVVRGAADSSTRFTISEVKGTTVYRLECSRN